MKVSNYNRPNSTGVRARIERGPDTFVCVGGRWEWYRRRRSGPRKGTEDFQCFVDDPRHVAVLGLAFRDEFLLPWEERPPVEPTPRLIPRERTYRLVDDPEAFAVVEAMPATLWERRRTL